MGWQYHAVMLQYIIMYVVFESTIAITQKTEDLATGTLLKIVGELLCTLI
jgi:hypothetical protein